MADHTNPELPYRPLVAKKLGQDPESTELACKHLENTGDDGLAAIKSGGTNKVETSHNIPERAGDRNTVPKADSPRDFALTYEPALQLQSTQVQQSDKGKSETLRQRAEFLSNVLAQQEAETEELRDMIEEGRREHARWQSENARRRSELVGAKEKIIQLKARVQQLEQQKRQGRPN